MVEFRIWILEHIARDARFVCSVGDAFFEHVEELVPTQSLPLVQLWCTTTFLDLHVCRTPFLVL